MLKQFTAAFQVSTIVYNDFASKTQKFTIIITAKQISQNENGVNSKIDLAKC